MNPLDNSLQQIRDVLKEGAQRADSDLDWPTASWNALQQGGVLEWSIPADFGGRGMSAHELLHGHEYLAGACITTTFLLSQREAAVRRLVDGGNEKLRRALLPPLVRGERFATVGLSQLTTSRQHVRPALTAQHAGTAWILNGIMPWVTGAPRADYFVTGAVLDDGRQLLLVLPRDLPGIFVAPSLDLMALRGSLTAEVRLTDVRVDQEWVLAGPALQIMATGRGGTGGLETSCLALGLAGAAIDYLAGETATRPDLAAGWKSLEAARNQLRTDLHALIDAGTTPQAAAALRSRANRLVLGATQAALTTAKGSGFVRGHPAQLWARQALFFLVWSCPRPAAEATIAHLTDFSEPEA